MSYNTERNYSMEELKQRNNASLMQALDTETQVIVTEKNWRGLLSMTQNIVQTLEEVLTKEDLESYLNQIISINRKHLDRMENTEETFLEQAGKLSGEFSSGSKAVCETAKESVKSICSEASRSLRDLTSETRNTLKDMLDETRKQLRASMIFSTVWTVILATLCVISRIWR